MSDLKPKLLNLTRDMYYDEIPRMKLFHGVADKLGVKRDDRVREASAIGLVEGPPMGPGVHSLQLVLKAHRQFPLEQGKTYVLEEDRALYFGYETVVRRTLEIATGHTVTTEFRPGLAVRVGEKLPDQTAHLEFVGAKPVRTAAKRRRSGR